MKTFLLFFSALPLLGSPADKTAIKVFILAGQSNMEGKAKVSLVEYQAKQPATRSRFAHFQKGAQWIKRDDVFIKFLDRKGPLTIGYGRPTALARNCNSAGRSATVSTNRCCSSKLPGADAACGATFVHPASDSLPKRACRKCSQTRARKNLRQLSTTSPSPSAPPIAK